MHYVEILTQLFETLVVPILGLVAAYIIFFIKSKINALKASTNNEMAIKYLSMLESTVTNCVLATNQTYVDSLKGKNAFDATAQKMALEITHNSVMSTLTEESKKYLSEVTGDLDKFVNEMIEAKIAQTKK